MRPRSTRAWTDVQAIEAVRQWAAGHGGHPPQTVDFASDPALPSRTYVQRHFGGLAPLRARAGLAPGASGHGGRRGVARRGRRRKALCMMRQGQGEDR
jgi:hypothetical protein